VIFNRSSVKKRGADAQRISALPDYIVACVGGGSNAMGMFYPFLNDKEVKLVGVEAAVMDWKQANMPHFVSRVAGRPARREIVCLQDKNGQILETHSISAGLDYPGVGRNTASQRQRPATIPASPIKKPGRFSTALPSGRYHSGIGIVPCDCPCVKMAERSERAASRHQSLRRGDKDLDIVNKALGAN